MGVSESPTEDHELKSSDETQLVSLRSAELDSEKALARILIAPWGEVESTRGNFVIDQEAVAATIEQFRQHGTDLPIDFEHQTLGGPYSSPDGLAPAAGWIKNLIGVESVGLMAEVEWTELGREHLRRRQYRYLSPVAMVRKSDRRMTGLHSAALTNKPAIVGMEAIVNRVTVDAEDSSTQNSESVRAPDGIGTGSAHGSTKNTREDHSMLEALDALRRQLNVDHADGARLVLSAASRRITELEGQQEQQRAEERVSAAMAAGKLTEAQRDCALRLALKDAESFDEWADRAPVVIVLGKIAGPESADPVDRRAHGAGARAKIEYQADSLLQALTSEEAFVQQAIRECRQ